MHPDVITEERRRVVLEATSWLRTPFGHHQRVKGVQVDCAGFVAEVYERAGVMPHVELPEYVRDWFAHAEAAGRNLYFDALSEHFVELNSYEKPQAGDLATYRWGVCNVAHAAVVVAWPSVVYASSWSAQRAVELGEGDRGPMGHRLSGWWTLRRWLDG